MEPTKALSWKQPWAWLCARGIMRVDNRPQHTTKAGERIFIHTSLMPDLSVSYFEIGEMDVWRTLDRSDRNEFMKYARELRIAYVQHTAIQWRYVGPRYFGCGVLYGEVDITGCDHESDDPFFTGPHGLTLSRAALYADPIPMKGQQGFFNVDLSKAIAELKG